jgi:hypothetical protein
MANQTDDTDYFDFAADLVDGPRGPAAASRNNDFDFAADLVGGPRSPSAAELINGPDTASARMLEAYKENAISSANSSTGPGRARLIGPWTWSNKKERGEQINPNKIKFKPNPKISPNRTLEELSSIISVNDIISQETKTITEFFEDNKVYNPFVLVDKVRENSVTYSGNAIDWDIGNKEYVECIDDAPTEWWGQNAYKQYIKPPEAGGRRFIKVFLNGASIFILKPDWYDSGVVPGNHFFRVIKALPVFKYMSLDLATQNVAPGFSTLGANHCNQNSPQETYSLVELSLTKLNGMVPRGGGTKRRIYSKRRKQSKKRYSKRRKQSKKRYSKRRKA